MLDRKTFKLPFRVGSHPQWMCPTCSKGTLVIRKDSFHKEEACRSRRARNNPAWEPHWIEYVFSCLTICGNASCKEVVTCSGTGVVNFDITYDEFGAPDQTYEEFFSPRYFAPHLRLFICPKGAPEQVEEELEASFELFFANPASASSHVRMALEHLLTALKVKRFTTNGGRRWYLNLHKRIELLPKKYDSLKELFFAVKWLGNAGSHSERSISNDDVLDAYEIMQKVLDELYVRSDRRAAKIARRINKRKGPAR